MSPLTLLLAYCVLIALASWLGGYVPLRLKLGHTAMQTLMSAVAGFMFGVALLHMLGHALPDLQDHPGGTQTALLWLLAGFLAMFFTERFFTFHVHDPQRAEVATTDDAHDEHPHPHSCDDHDHHHQPKLSWTGATVGMTIHSLIGGLALGAAMAPPALLDGHADEAGVALIGLPVFLAIVLHKPLDALTITALAKSGGLSHGSTLLLNFVFAWVVPIGALAAWFGLTAFFADKPEVLAYALCFSAGTFVCVALSDLLPEVQFHQHDRVKLSAALLVGLALAWSVGLIEHAVGHDHHGHGHGHEHAEPHDEDRHHDTHQDTAHDGHDH